MGLLETYARSLILHGAETSCPEPPPRVHDSATLGEMTIQASCQKELPENESSLSSSMSEGRRYDLHGPLGWRTAAEKIERHKRHHPGSTA